MQFLAAYSVEWTLSADNVLAFLVVLTALAVPARWRHRVLFLGSLGAIAMRLTLILAGTTLLDHATWTMYVFGMLLLLAAARFALEPEGDAGAADPVEPRASGLLRRLVPVSSTYVGGRLTTVVGGRRLATPLLFALLAVALTDVMFATDFPHIECDWPNTRPFAERLFAGVPPDEAFKIAAGNMLEFFRLADTPMGRKVMATAA